MKVSLSAILLSLTSINQCFSMDWKPTYNDKPLNEKQLQLIEEALPDTPIVEPKEERRVLVFSATAGFRHGSIPAGKQALKRLGESTGAYSVLVSDDPANFEPDALKNFDTVLLLSPTQDFFMPSNKERDNFSNEEWAALKERHTRLVDNLVNYVKSGGGLMGIHAATDGCYGHKEFGETIGGHFWGHPWSAGHNVTIVVEDPKHGTIQPVFGNMADFKIQDEIYQFKEEPYSREKLRVLLHLDPERSDPVDPAKIRRKDCDFPVCWVQQVGEGRVFYSSLGHNHHIYWNPLILRHFLAGIQFACGDLEADTTPSAKISIPNVQ
ncbi:MAG: ThuA domain-containing protein [Coraliomargaritaceae bacterium]